MAALAHEAVRSRRRMVALGIVSDRLREIGLEPILVGGGALEYYTAGGHATGDVDLALPHGEDVDRAFADLGFAKEGRFWIRDDLELYFEAPAPAGLPGEDAPRTVVEVDGMKVVIIGLEDLLMDRVRAWVHWNSAEDYRWSVHLAAVYADRLDWDYLASRASDNPEERAALQRLREEVYRLREGAE
ncbi:MAG: hypothetical protein FJZ01_28590 [Candidatus Sericytochromatia bacterium]|nr:hypothetical protein [Candidatus Tanganyikabacteria bacterium]